MILLIAHPWLAVLLAGLFALLGMKRPGLLAVAGLWAGYGVYEYLMYFRILCSGECNIRVDLLLVYPLLIILTLLGLWRSWRATPR